MAVANSRLFKVKLAKSVCLEGISEDTIRLLVDSLEVEVTNEELLNLVFSTGSVPVKFQFGSDGNFTGVYAKQGGMQVPIIPGLGSQGLYLFKGAPTATNPGAGFKTEFELTKKYFSQPPDETTWEIFLASRVAVVNNIE